MHGYCNTRNIVRQMRIASRSRSLSFLSKLHFRLFSGKIASRNLVSSLLVGVHSALVAFQFKYLRLDWALWSIACHSVYHAHSANPAHDRICTESHDGTERYSFVSDFCQEARRLTLPTCLTLSHSLSVPLFPSSCSHSQTAGGQWNTRPFVCTQKP